MTNNHDHKTDLPAGWVWVKHNEVSEVNVKPDFSNIDDDTEVSFVPMAAVEEKTGNFNLEQIRIFKDVKKGYTPFVDGDLIFAKITPCMENGKIAVLSKLKNGMGFGSTEFHTSRFHPQIVSKFYFYYFLQEAFRRDARGAMTGSAGQLRVPSGYFKEVELPLPPLAEQQRIVAKIEELFSDLDHSVAALKTARQQLDIYRQAVLKHAFEGKLTEQWRQQHQPPPAAELLARIQTERAASGKPAKSLPPLTEAELAELPSLPEGWGWVRLGSLIEEPKYGTSKKCRYEVDGTPVLRIPNIGDGIIDEADLKFAQFSEDEKDVYSLKEGDLLTIRSNGSVDLVGKCALVTEKSEKFLFAGYLIRLRPFNQIANPRFLLQVLSSPNLRIQIESKAKSTSGVNNINAKELEGLIVPYPWISEQRVIVEEIEARLSVVDNLEQTIATALQQAAALRQSILKQAFAGKLVPQHSDDEPAEKLLERIKTQKSL